MIESKEILRAEPACLLLTLRKNSGVKLLIGLRDGEDAKEPQTNLEVSDKYTDSLLKHQHRPESLWRCPGV